MAADFAALETEVARLKDVDASAIALINGIAARIQAAVDADNLADNTETAKLAADLAGQTDALAAAVTQNTPAQPPTP